MGSKFRIIQGGNFLGRPPISYRVREYLEEVVTEDILKKHNIIVNSNWNIALGVIFVGSGPYFTAKEVIVKTKPRTIGSEKTKLFTALIPLITITESDEPYTKTVKMMFEAIKQLLTLTYRKVTAAEMDELWGKLDFDYLRSLPYPAPFSEQKYAGEQ
jgi:hypothetical protein